MHIKILPGTFPNYFSAIMFRLIKHYSPQIQQYWRFNKIMQLQKQVNVVF